MLRMHVSASVTQAGAELPEPIRHLEGTKNVPPQFGTTPSLPRHLRLAEHAMQVPNGPPKENQNHITATLAEPVQTRNLKKWFMAPLLLLVFLLYFVAMHCRDVSRSHWLPCLSDTCCNAASLIVVTQIAVQCGASQSHHTAPVPIFVPAYVCETAFHLLTQPCLPRYFVPARRYYSVHQHPLFGPDHHQIDPSLTNRVSANFPGNLLICFPQPSEPLAASTHKANHTTICSLHLPQPI